LNSSNVKSPEITGFFIGEHFSEQYYINIYLVSSEKPEWKEGAGALTGSPFISQIEGTEVKLSCPAKGRPKPELIWYKDDSPFFPRTDKVSFYCLSLMLLATTNFNHATSADQDQLAHLNHLIIACTASY
jgi:hypothetical protein